MKETEVPSMIYYQRHLKAELYIDNNDDASEIKASWRPQFEKSLNKIVNDRVPLVLTTRLGRSSAEFGR
uniref:Uncharacterized protein n=1 Tax=Glossina pallidipes TaxID=7398 RepID=A0A1A9ZGG5_GLOPL